MFEQFKKEHLSKLEKTTIKTDLDGETVYLKKGTAFAWIPILGKCMADWSRIYPAVNEDGSWNFVNLIFGGRRNFINLLILMLIVTVALVGVYQMVNSCSAMASNPCGYFKDLTCTGGERIITRIGELRLP